MMLQCTSCDGVMANNVMAHRLIIEIVWENAVFTQYMFISVQAGDASVQVNCRRRT
jgi:hypothetical protein